MVPKCWVCYAGMTECVCDYSARNDCHAASKIVTATRFQLCFDCEFGFNGAEAGICEKVSVIYPSIKTVRSPEFRLRHQNYLVRLQKPYRLLIDEILNGLSDFKGYYKAEDGQRISAPGFGPLLTDGADWWMRDITVGGLWETVSDVPAWQDRMAGRWRLIGVWQAINETIQPLCLSKK